MNETTAEAVRAMRDACAAIADDLAHGIEMGVDRMRDYERGGLSTARHLGRRIRELDPATVIAAGAKR